MKKLGLVLIMVLASLASAQGWQAGALNYDINKEQTLQGAITQVRIGQASGLGQYELGTEVPVNLFIAPFRYQDRMGIRIREGDKIEVTGALGTNRAGNEVFMVRVLIHNNRTHHLRDTNGIPAWAGQGRGRWMGRGSAFMGNRPGRGRGCMGGAPARGRWSGRLGPGSGDCFSLLPKTSSATLSEAETGYLILMREEEKLARDLYRTFYETHGLRIFANIAGAEQRHMDAVKILLERYSLEDPVAGIQVGVFTSERFNLLYQELANQGKESIAAALEVGAHVEDLDLADLKTALNATEKEDISMVFQNLMKGSRNHLRAFTRRLEDWDLTYRSKYLSQEEIDRILDSPFERGLVYDGKGEVIRTTRGRGGRGCRW